VDTGFIINAVSFNLTLWTKRMYDLTPNHP